MSTTGEGPFAGLDVPAGGFRKVYADPPWGWVTWGGSPQVPHRSPDAPYSTMTMDELKALPVGAMMARNSACFMWTVSSHVDQAIDLMRAWGFTFRTVAFVWVKTDKAGRPRMSLGRWTRQEAEICLMGARGRPPRRPKPHGTGVRQVIMERPREHSRKPDGVRDRIDLLIEGPAIELFSRSSKPGWAAWGNELGKYDAVSTAAHAATAPPAPATACVADRPGHCCDCAGCRDRRDLIAQTLRA